MACNRAALKRSHILSYYDLVVVAGYPSSSSSRSREPAFCHDSKKTKYPSIIVAVAVS
jgi:hypothetical protein